jgi:pyrroline-5-carboxylate reductase
MERIADEYPGVNTSQNIPEALHQADLLLLCVKPQNLTKSFFDQVHQSTLHDNAIVLSIIAGRTISFFIDGSRGKFSKVVRSMPNTPAMIGQGMTVWSATDNLSTEERTKIKKILSGFGKAVRRSYSCIIIVYTTRSIALVFVLCVFVCLCFHGCCCVDDSLSLLASSSLYRFAKLLLSTHLSTHSSLHCYTATLYSMTGLVYLFLLST